MNITVLEELRAYIDPLTTDEHQALERSILAEGCRDALVLWGEVLVDGHNRYGICRKHGLSFQTVQNDRFRSMDDVHLWMIDQHLGRRSVSDFQRGVLALRKKEIITARRNQAASESAPVAVAAVEGAPPTAEPLNTREAIAKAARISSNTVVQIEKIQKNAAPELVEAVRQGTISINAAAAVASLPSEEQVAAVAGGKKELRDAAKRVREARSASRMPVETSTEIPAQAGAPPWESDEQVAQLQQAVDTLMAENAALKQQVADLQARLAELTAIAP
ncbi:MAG: plasmid replication/partition related protein [Burkholderiaceae bacterium]|nr:plasmid replication/partition related protein [Burkholderiaceae bacterium]